MKKLLLVATVLLLGFSSGVHANRENLPTSEQAVAFAHRLMMDISRGKTREAWRKLKANSLIPPDRVDAFAADYERQLVETIQFLGQSQGVELIAEEAFGRSVMRVTYLMKYQVSGIAWFVYFYKVDDQWLISEFNFDLNSNVLFRNLNRTGSPTTMAMTIQQWQEEVDGRLQAVEAQLVGQPGEGDSGETSQAEGGVNGTAPDWRESVEAELSLLRREMIGLSNAVAHDQDGSTTQGTTVAMEQRLGALESRLDELATAERLLAVEKQVALLGEGRRDPPASPPGPDVQQPASDQEGAPDLVARLSVVEAQLAELAAGNRLLALEEQLAAFVDQQVSSATLDDETVTRILDTLDTLKKHHPYAEFPDLRQPSSPADDDLKEE